MTQFEIKKVLAKTSSKIALLLLILLVGSTCYFAVGKVAYVNEQGDSETGVSAVRKLRDAKNEWAGELTGEKLRQVIEANDRINRTVEYRSENEKENNIAYSWKQGFGDIRNLLVRAFCEFREFDYYRPDSLSPEDAENFYTRRIEQLKTWLDGEAKDAYSLEEKDFLMKQYEELKTPLEYGYADGWKQVFEFTPALLMIMTLIMGFLVAGIFPGEFQTKACAVFYTSYHGRGKAVAAKIKAGFLLITAVYWASVLLYSGIVLGILGADGAGLAVQTSAASWISLYHITFGQAYLIIFAGGYVGILFVLFLTMLVSAKTGSSVLAVIIPFILIFIPSFLTGSSIPVIRDLVGLLPDQLLQLNMTLSMFNIYRIGGRIYGSLGILPVLYAVLTLLIVPAVYHIYRRAQIK